MSTVEEQRAARRDDDSADGDSASDESARKPLVIGLLTAPGLTHRVGLRLRRQLSSKLSERFPGFEWKIVVREEVLAGAGITLAQVHHGDGVATWPVMARGLTRGHGIRVGLEDTTVLADGTPAPDNAALVRAAAAMMLP